MAGQDHKLIKRTNDLLQTLKQANGDIEALQHAAEAADADALSRLFDDSFEAVRKHIVETLNPNREQQIEYCLKFLHGLAATSADFQERMRQAGLYLANLNDVVADNAKIVALQNLLGFALQNQTQLRQDLINELIEAKAITNSHTEKFMRGLQQYMQRQKRKELDDMGSNIIITSNRNIMYDRERRLGAAVSALVNTLISVPLALEFHPNAMIFDHEPLEGADAEFNKLRTNISGVPF